MIELIEHLEPRDIDKAMSCIFGSLKPQYLFLTTPNIEYNQIIKKAFGSKIEPKFRHPDHKFEWTRQQFEHWVKATSDKFNYTTIVGGIGKLYDGNDDGSHGFASHSVLFIRQEMISRPIEPPSHSVYQITQLIKVEKENYEFALNEEYYSQYNSDYYFSKEASETDDEQTNEK